MELELVCFRGEHYPEYASWFSDPELDSHLGPMGQDWLDAVLNEPEEEGITWVVFRDGEMVAVVEIGFDPGAPTWAGFAGLAVKPSLKRQGIGTAVLQRVLALHEGQGRTEHMALVKADNAAGQRLVEKVGFVAEEEGPNEEGFIRYRRNG